MMLQVVRLEKDSYNWRTVTGNQIVKDFENLDGPHGLLSYLRRRMQHEQRIEVPC